MTIGPPSGLDYTRVNEDATILCRRHDFPRAVNVLQRRAPDHRRWRLAVRRVAGSSAAVLEGARRAWMVAAVRDVVAHVPEPWLRRELAVDLHALSPDYAVREVLPWWTARDLWWHADAEGLPMEYVAQVAPLPRAIDALVDTAAVVLACRKTAVAHRDAALELAGTPDARLQCDAAERWRALARRLLAGP